MRRNGKFGWPQPIRLWMALLCVCLGRIQGAAQDNMAAYNDSLVNGWQSYGWATLDYANTANVHAGSHAIKVQAAAWEALYLHHEALDTSLFANLVFWIHGGPTGGQKLNVQATLNGQAQPAVQLSALPANSWKQITLSLASLGVAGKSGWDGFWIQDRSGTAQAAFYVDDISITVVPPPAKVTCTINAAVTNRLVDARWFGLNTAVWDAYFDTPNTLELLRGIDCQALRFPGGSLSDEYHWAANKTGTNTWTWATSFDKFLHVATNLGAQLCLTVNYGSGTPEEAAAWVRYANITKGCNCRYWEIGNENYGSWEMDTNPLPHDPYTYAVRAKEYFTQMKAVDPAIKIGVVAVTGEDAYSNGYTSHPATNPRTGKTHHGWTPVMLSTLKQLGVTPDFLIYHRYAQNPGGENDFSLLRSSKTWADDAMDLRAQLTDYLGASGAAVELLCTENNSVSSGPGKQTTSLVNGLFMVDSLAQLAQTEFNGMFWWDLRNGRDTNENNSAQLFGWREYGDYGLLSGTNDPYPTYYAARLMQYFIRGGDVMVEASTDYALLSAYASRRTNGELALLIINKSDASILVTQISLGGFAPAGSAVIYRYGLPQDYAAQTGTDGTDILQSSFTVPSATFSFVFAPYSLTVIRFAPAADNTPLRLGWKVQGDASSLAFTLSGPATKTAVVQTSTNLIDWVNWQTNQLTGSAIQLPALAPASQLYLRALVRP